MKRKHLIVGTVVSNLLGVLPQFALAQTAPAESETLELEEVVITGTSIRGIAPVGSAPVEYGRADIEADAPVNISDALSNIPQLTNFGSEQQLSTTNRFRTAGYIPVIHNMEIGSTLSLFNGHRMAPVGAEATFADPGIIPTIALDRVEVVADGNSAIYGSDAVAGVVNFLYRRGVEGFEVDLSTTLDPDTSFENRKYSLLWGKTFDRGEVMVAFERSEHNAAKEKEFWFAATGDQTSRGGTDRRTTTCSEPRVTYGSTDYSGPNRTAGPLYRCDPNGDFTIGFNTRRDAVLATARFRPIDGVEFWGELNWSDIEEYQLTNWTNIDVRVPNTSPYFWVPSGATTTPATERVRRAAVGLWDPRVQPQTSEVRGLTLGASFDVGATWKTDIRVHHSKTEDTQDTPVLDTTRMQQLTTAGLFNPLGNAADNDPAVLAQINNGAGTYNWGSQTLSEIEIKADGPLFLIPGGEVKAALGISHRTETLKQIQDVGCLNGCSFFIRQRDSDLARGVNAAFLEVAVPVFSNANAITGIQELTLSLAGRYDKYDLLDGELTPKFGFNYRPVDSVSIYGSAGKSYAAPNIGSITDSFGLVQLAVNIQGTIWDIYNMGGGNPDLKSETADTYSYGFKWEPEFLAGFSAGASYYNVAYENVVYKPSRNDVVFNPAFTSARIVGNEATPTTPVAIAQSIIDEVIAIAPPNIPIVPGQVFTLVHRSYAINLGKRNFAGIDINVRYDFDNSLGKWGVALNGNKQLVKELQVLPGTPFVSDIGSRNAPEWQARFQAQWASNVIPLRLTWVSNYLSGYEDRFGNACCEIGSNLLHNLTAAYDFENIFNGVTVQARVINLTDKDPPFYDGTLGYDDDNHTPYGRQYALSLRARF